MNIRTDLQPIQPVAGESPVAALNKAATSGEIGVSVGNDQAHLSAAASLASHAASLSDVRSGKVASVQAAMAAGTYSVSSSDVAQSLMNYMLGGKE